MTHGSQRRDKWIAEGLAWAQYLWDNHRISSLPIARDGKVPLMSTSKFYTGRHISLDVFRSFGTGNLAVRCGQLNKLVVLDVDNREKAKDWFISRKPLPRTWASKTGSGGLHMWFRVPDYFNGKIPNVRLWKGEDKHEEIAVIGDGKQVIAPPSKLQMDGRTKVYKWENGFSPLQIKIAYAPLWLLKESVDLAAPPPLPPVPYNGDFTLPVGRTSSVLDTTFLDRIPNKLQLLQGWGLRLARNTPNIAGYLACYRPGEKDDHPSASVKADTGQVWVADRGTMSFIDAAVALGRFPDSSTAVKELKEIYK